ncbi:hypothetical protein DBV15_10645 [Temnothorax longispinosus]|uniref:Uncharacterized protein n=1 Tax=Temnothorax longispinosus TaxID=300112 RepID=A0A4S2JSQ8_9HYME|nr:hypothetical protein DBV15_10645 [Temnothorax longispinosus]
MKLDPPGRTKRRKLRQDSSAGARKKDGFVRTNNQEEPASDIMGFSNVARKGLPTQRNKLRKLFRIEGRSRAAGVTRSGNEKRVGRKTRSSVRNLRVSRFACTSWGPRWCLGAVVRRNKWFSREPARRATTPETGGSYPANERATERVNEQEDPQEFARTRIWVKESRLAIDSAVSCRLRNGDHTAKVQQVVSRSSMLRHHRCYSTDGRGDLIRGLIRFATGVVASAETSSNETMVMRISASEAGVPLLGAVGPRYVVKQATVKRCVLALLLVSIISILYYTHYIISSGPLSSAAIIACKCNGEYAVKDAAEASLQGAISIEWRETSRLTIGSSNNPRKDEIVCGLSELAGTFGLRDDPI